ncbi:bifunctional ADP-dependent NAD(P)H-hydrate dehydratase/NAD(P)H-hydrate epimerase [Luminiphilus syltensis]|nr:bifunctional ADP-dependent NAD(P)H-hydrate dehydratase/NAD(P)H-hydrate epimerase [Luminiphilus syltensis]
MISSQIERQLYTADQVRALDARAINQADVPGSVLMERAGAAAFRHLGDEWPNARVIHVICGTGNNGGDGWVIARLAADSGLQVSLTLIGDEGRIGGDAKTAYLRFIEAYPQIAIRTELRLPPDPEAGPAAAPTSDQVVVDALLGTGYRGALREAHRSVIARINDAGLPVLAIDCPSGLDASTGSIPEVAVKACLTVTFIGAKFGLYTGDGVDVVGEIREESLQVPAWVFDDPSPVAALMSLEHQRASLPKLPRSAHKGRRGHVLVVGGDYGFGGAAIMAAEAALRSGAGLVSLATRTEHLSAMMARQPEVMVTGVGGAADLRPLLARASVVAIGPGLGQSEWGQSLLGAVLDARCPLVVDADGLNLLANSGSELPAGSVMTPHPGEAARLLGVGNARIAEDRLATTRALQTQYQATIVLKGAGSIVIDQDERFAPGVCPYGNPGMGSGGMGDVLTGVIAALMARGLSAGNAARLGVCAHARAADWIAREVAHVGYVATDLMAPIQRLLAGRLD